MAKILPDLIRNTGESGAKSFIGFADNCGGQNKSTNTIMFLSVLLNSFTHLNRAEIHYIPKGNHGFAPDNAHATARKDAKDKTHECPDAIFKQIASASSKFVVYEMTENSDFVTTKPFALKFLDLTTKSRRNTVNGVPLRFSEATVFCLDRQEHPTEIGVKYTLYPDEPFIWYSLLKNNRDAPEFFSIKLEHLLLKYPPPIGKLIPIKKKKDLTTVYQLCQSNQAKVHLNYLLSNKKFGDIEDDPDDRDLSIEKIRLHTEEELAAINESELESLTKRDKLLKEFDRYCPREEFESHCKLQKSKNTQQSMHDNPQAFKERKNSQVIEGQIDLPENNSSVSSLPTISPVIQNSNIVPSNPDKSVSSQSSYLSNLPNYFQNHRRLKCQSCGSDFIVQGCEKENQIVQVRCLKCKWINYVINPNLVNNQLPQAPIQSRPVPSPVISQSPQVSQITGQKRNLSPVISSSSKPPKRLRKENISKKRKPQKSLSKPIHIKRPRFPRKDTETSSESEYCDSDQENIPHNTTKNRRISTRVNGPITDIQHPDFDYKKLEFQDTPPKPKYPILKPGQIVKSVYSNRNYVCTVQKIPKNHKPLPKHTYLVQTFVDKSTFLAKIQKTRLLKPHPNTK